MTDLLPPIALQVAFVSGAARLTTKSKAPITRVEWDSAPRAGDTFAIRIPAGTVEQQRAAISDLVGDIIDRLRHRYTAELDPDALPENIYRAEKAKRAARALATDPMVEAKRQFDADEASLAAVHPWKRPPRRQLVDTMGGE